MNLFYTNFVEPIGAFSKLDQQVKYLKEVHQFHEHQLAQERQLKML